MIFSNIAHAQECLAPDVQRCLDYAKAHDLRALSCGRHDIDGDRLFVNIVEYQTKERDNCIWEAHKAYLDLHLMLDGEEIIDVGFIGHMEQAPYQAEGDYLPLEGQEDCSVVLSAGNFLVCYPDDGHRTSVQVQQPQQIKKAIFKIRISDK